MDSLASSNSNIIEKNHSLSQLDQTQATEIKTQNYNSDNKKYSDRLVSKYPFLKGFVSEEQTSSFHGDKIFSTNTNQKDSFKERCLVSLLLKSISTTDPHQTLDAEKIF